MLRLSPLCLRHQGHGARPVPVSEWVHLYSISSCTIQPSFLSLVFNHTTSAFDPVLHLRVRAIKLSSFLFLVSLEDVKSLDPFWLSFSTNPLCGYGTQRDLQEPLFTYARNVTANANHKPATLLLYHDLRVTTNRRHGQGVLAPIDAPGGVPDRPRERS